MKSPKLKPHCTCNFTQSILKPLSQEVISSKMAGCTNQPAVFIDTQVLVYIWQASQTSLRKKKPVNVWQWCYYNFLMEVSIGDESQSHEVGFGKLSGFWQMWRQIFIMSEIMMFTMHMIPKLVWWSMLWYYLLILGRKHCCFMLIIILFPCHVPSPVIIKYDST